MCSSSSVQRFKASDAVTGSLQSFSEQTPVNSFITCGLSLEDDLLTVKQTVVHVGAGEGEADACSTSVFGAGSIQDLL